MIGRNCDRQELEEGESKQETTGTPGVKPLVVGSQGNPTRWQAAIGCDGRALQSQVCHVVR